MRGGRLVTVLAICVAILASCTDDSTKPSASDPGALVKTTMHSVVGVVLDELPESMRERVAKDLAEKPLTFWTDRARSQLHLTAYRLNFRDSFYDGKAQLPLPPEAVWNIALVDKPVRQKIDGHDVVAITYEFDSFLLTDPASPAASEPKLAKIGGLWREPFILPVDPELVMQRTGYACLDEADFPFNSVDSEEVDSFYDQDAVVEEELSNIGQSHFTVAANQDCVDAVRDHIGHVDTSVTFERIKWDTATADKVRYGTVTGDSADLEIYAPEFGPSRVTYRYITDTSCDVAEGSVGATGWRRLLQFATSDENVGNQPLVIGSIDYNKDGSPQTLDTHNLFEFSPCHKHYHFKYYGDLSWNGNGPTVNSKKGFCLQSTARASNREGSPLPNPFGTCHYQGVAPGWIDEYKAGLPGQWIDVTSFPPGPGTRSFASNPKGFLCEGIFVDEDGKPLSADADPIWSPTGLTADNGEPVEAPLCKLGAAWNVNNSDSHTDTLPPLGEGLITSPCERGQIGPLRNCGFGGTPSIVQCDAGQPATATFALPPNAPPQVVRISEYSTTLMSAIPARYEDAYVPLSPGVGDQPYMLGNSVVTADEPITLTFTCPSPRTNGTPEPGGTYSVYSGPAFPGDASVVLITHS